MLIHKDSHLDHGLSQDVVAYLTARFADRHAFFIETVELPAELGMVPCGLYGPVMGDAPITDAYCAHQKRGERAYTSRMLVDFPIRKTRLATVIAGPHEDLACILYTAFGGPATPKEPNDPTLAPEKLAESEEFWREHALVQ